MSRAFNFCAGPAALPEAVLRQAQAELLEWGAERASVMEVSHRGAAFEALIAQAEADLRALMDIPDDYAVLFLQGGATQQFALLPMNLAAPGQGADYVVSGHWSARAVAEADPHVRTRVLVDAADSEGRYLQAPLVDPATIDADAAYLHYCHNETIHGVEFPEVPDSGDVPLVGDFSSTILSRPLDVRRFGGIYAGAQKNIGPSGLALVIVRRDLLERAGQPRARVLTWAAHARAGSLLHTPPTFSIYLAALVFAWLREMGGLEVMAAVNQRKAQRLYQAIDASEGFYANPVEAASRSWMNVPFWLHDEGLVATFLEESREAGLLALKGHREIGGLRASLYNAMPEAGVAALVDFMGDFARRKG